MRDSEERKGSSPEADGYPKDFSARLSEVIHRVGGRKNAAAKAMVSVDQLDRWRDGRSRPSLFGIGRLCAAAEVSVDWLLGSKGAPAQSDALTVSSYQPELLGRIIDRIARVYKETGLRISEIDKGRIAAERYAEVANLANGPDEWPALLDLMEVRLRKTLQAAGNAPGQTKREVS